mmetsp:Transcript_69658/g.193868  ORF Transcript_69658/g.193868 Transcript_69658/m.193868 type:complete len:421 (-) Transcript_69658:115-1377(-)
MPEASPKPTAGARSHEITEELERKVSQVEHSFRKSFNRNVRFKREKLLVADRQLDVQRQMAQAASSSLGSHQVPTTPHGGGGVPVFSSNEERGGSSCGVGSADMRRSRSSPNGLSVGTRKGGGLGSPRSEDLGSPKRGGSGSPHATATVLFGSLSHDPRDLGYTMSRPPGSACSRLGASMPFSRHPVPHPGADIGFGKRGGSRSDPRRHFLTPDGMSQQLPFLSPVSRRSMTGHMTPTTPTVGDDSRAAMRTPSPDSAQHQRPLPASGSSLTTLLHHLRGPGDTEEELTMALDAMNDEYLGELHGRPAQSPEMIKRLGSLMELFGPRYKTVSKDMIWERAEKGDLSPFQRRLKKDKEIGAGPKDFLSDLPKTAPGAELDGVGLDPDGPARRQWLAARMKIRRDKPTQDATTLALQALAPP